MTKYIAEIVIDNKAEQIEFQTDVNPIEYLWSRYGMDTFIATLSEIGQPVEVKDLEG